MRKFHNLVIQARAKYTHKNQILHRRIYVEAELSRPTGKEWDEISPLLQEMAEMGTTLGLDSTPEERYNYDLYCSQRMLRIKLINPVYYSTIVIQFDNLK